jgi:hypothetical protein
MEAKMTLHPFIIPDKKLIDKLQALVNEGELYIYSDMESAVKHKNSVIFCFGWVNGILEENGIYYFICRVLEDIFKKTLAIQYSKDEVVNLYLI